LRKLILYTAASLDNFIARPDGAVDWLHSPEYFIENEDYGYSDFYQTIDTTLMGNKTHQFILDQDVPFPYPDKSNFVFSRSAINQDTQYVKFMTGDIIEFVRKLKDDNGKDIWLIGGGQVNTLMLNYDLIDKIILSLVPIILGEGILLFNGNSKEAKFDLESSKSYKSGFLQLTLIRK
jgi:dihydrofolate reductase